MKPITFEHATVIGKPANMTDEECVGLPAIQGVTEEGWPFTLSRWEPSDEDRAAIAAGGSIWVRTLSHVVHPFGLFTTNDAGDINR